MIAVNSQGERVESGTRQRRALGSSARMPSPGEVRQARDLLWCLMAQQTLPDGSQAFSPVQIAARFGVHRGTVYRRLKQLRERAQEGQQSAG